MNYERTKQNIIANLMFLPPDRDLHTKYPREMHVVYQEVQPHLLTQSWDLFHDQLPSVTLRHDLVSVRCCFCR